MKAAKYGRIINIASVHGLVASVNKSAYVAAKHGYARPSCMRLPCVPVHACIGVLLRVRTRADARAVTPPACLRRACRLIGFTKAVALETAGTGVTCNAICPGWVLTPLVQAQIELRAKQSGKSLEEAKRDLLLEKQPSGEFVKPEDLGGLATFLCSPAAAQMTGISMPMDGGWTSQ
ncbi:SDR family oxidoreductase [archaeon]|nr:MAG: SDR family oxidoreductase [archaeon]